MKTSSVSFSDLRRLLLDLHFTERSTETYWRFEHAKSGTIFLFRPYAPDDNVTMPDLATTRMQLDWRGLLAADEFDDSLTKTPA
jgi:hypothetical protein